MFIQTEETPNPATMKFIPGVTVMQSGVAEFNNQDSAADSPLATELFDISGIEGVFFGSDFITVTKTDNYSWQSLKPEILATIMDFFMAGKTVLNAECVDSEPNYENLGEIEKQIVEIIEHRVRPAVAMDGGDIIYRGFEDGIVMLQLRGACSGCPSSSATLKSGIENMLKHYVPEVIAVEAIN